MYPDLQLSTIERFKRVTTPPAGQPDYNPAMAVKDWIDPDAAAHADQDGNVSYTVLVYDSSGHIAKGADGKPYTRTLIMSVEKALSLNLLTSGQRVTLPLPGIVRMPLDLSKIPAGYRLDWDNGPSPMTMGDVVLHNPAVDPTDTVAWTRADHDMLTALFNALPKG